MTAASDLIAVPAPPSDAAAARERGRGWSGRSVLRSNNGSNFVAENPPVADDPSVGLAALSLRFTLRGGIAAPACDDAPAFLLFALGIIGPPVIRMEAKKKFLRNCQDSFRDTGFSVECDASESARVVE